VSTSQEYPQSWVICLGLDSCASIDFDDYYFFGELRIVVAHFQLIAPVRISITTFYSFAGYTLNSIHSVYFDFDVLMIDRENRFCDRLLLCSTAKTIATRIGLVRGIKFQNAECGSYCQLRSLLNHYYIL
jgi:hypothetical protein